MTVAQLLEQLSLEEFFDWYAFYVERNKQPEEEAPDWENMNPNEIGKAFNL